MTVVSCAAYIHVMFLLRLGCTCNCSVQHAFATCECNVLQILARATKIAELVAAEAAHETLLPADDDSHQQLSNMYSLADKVSFSCKGWPTHLQLSLHADTLE